MTDYDKEILVKLISQNKNTYQDIRSLLPHLSDSEIKYADDNPIRFINTPREYAIYKFSPDDTFELTEYGKNLLYCLQKEKHFEERTSHSINIAEESLAVAKEGTKYARLAFYAAVIFGILSVIPDVKEKLWHWLQLAFGLFL